MTNTAARMVVTGGVVFTLAVNFAPPATVKKYHAQGVAYTIGTVPIEAHRFDVGSLTGGVQWVQAGQVRIPMA